QLMHQFAERIAKGAGEDDDNRLVRGFADVAMLRAALLADRHEGGVWPGPLVQLRPRLARLVGAHHNAAQNPGKSPDRGSHIRPSFRTTDHTENTDEAIHALFYPSMPRNACTQPLAPKEGIAS